MCTLSPFFFFSCEKQQLKERKQCCWAQEWWMWNILKWYPINSSLPVFPSLPVHGLPHPFGQLAGVYRSTDESQRARPQHHYGHEANTRHRSKFWSIPLHVCVFIFQSSFISHPLLWHFYSDQLRFLSPSCQSDECILRAVPDNRARGTLHHFSMSATHICGVLPPAGVGPALRSAQSVDHNHDHCGYCWRHDPVGHWL